MNMTKHKTNPLGDSRWAGHRRDHRGTSSLSGLPNRKGSLILVSAAPVEKEGGDSVLAYVRRSGRDREPDKGAPRPVSRPGALASPASVEAANLHEPPVVAIVRRPPDAALDFRIATAADVQAWLTAGADVNAPRLYGLAPLHAAARRGHSEAVIVLLDAGASATAPSQEGKTPWDYALERAAEDPGFKPSKGYRHLEVENTCIAALTAVR